MSDKTQEKRVTGEGDAKTPDGHDKTTARKKLPPAKEQAGDSEDIERAVYDGMQDLRVEKTK
jgi:hypothetical protein